MGSSMTMLENPVLSSLSSGYFSDSTSFKPAGKVASNNVEDIQVVDQNDDEPSILATKSFLPSAQQQTVTKNLPQEGYSHLEWSSSVPYNVAEEPDDVQGKPDFF